ncbi:hypothetical protein PInf_025232 [Phytophthora infestans]|nr:hypothetical protein PInf_025232 [Phytophthora infestans]
MDESNGDVDEQEGGAVDELAEVDDGEDHWVEDPSMELEAIALLENELVGLETTDENSDDEEEFLNDLFEGKRAPEPERQTQLSLRDQVKDEVDRYFEKARHKAREASNN